MNSDMEELFRFASYATGSNSSLDALRMTALGDANSSANSPQDRSSVEKQSGSDVSALASEINRFAEAARVAAAVNSAPPKAAQTLPAGQDSSTEETVLRTAAMMTGVGPIVTGLMKLFGSDEPEPLPSLEKFQAPSSVSVEAGLSASREYSGLRYTQGGLPETAGGIKTGGAQTQTIQVNIQAMDSQSFLDRQDDIARAVREAMLHSNSLNDVVLEL